MSDVRDITAEFKLEKVLKTSPLTTVFLAVDPGSGDRAVLKVINPAMGAASDAGQQRFLMTMSALRSLRVQSCPELLDFGFTPDGGAFMVMGHVQGIGLESYTGLPPVLSLPPLIRLVGALEVLTAEQIHHHNLRPDNVLVLGGTVCKSVLILGLGTTAYLAPDDGGALLGQSPDSDPFAAPELFDPALRSPGDEWRSDLYSLALVICNMLGLPVAAAGSTSPGVVIPEQRGLLNPEPLATALNLALLRDPQKRMLSYTQLRGVLGAAMPPAPAGQGDRTERIFLSAPETPAQTPPAAPQPTAQPGPAAAGPPGVVPPPAPPAAASAPPAPPVPPRPPVLPVPPAPSVPPDTSFLPEPELAPPPIPRRLPEPSLSARDQLPSVDAAPSPPVKYSLPEPEPSLPPIMPAEPPTVPLQRHEASPPLPPAAPDSAFETAPVPAISEAVAEALPPQPEQQKTGGGLSPLMMAVIAGGSLVVIVMLIVTAFWLYKRINPPPAPVPPTPVIVQLPTPVPEPTPELPAVNPQLEQARLLLEAGDVAGARQMVEAIPDEELELLSEEEARIYDELQAAVQSQDAGEAAEALRVGLDQGSVKMIRRAVNVLEKVDDSWFSDKPKVAENLEKAQQALRLHSKMWSAQKSNDYLRVLEIAPELIALLPSYSGSHNMREEAAAALAGRAEVSIKAQDFNAAIRQLEEISARWPERQGISQRIAWCRRQLETVQTLESTLKSAQRSAAGGNPEEGLRLLGTVQPTGDYQARYAEAAKLFEAQLAEMDKAAPTVELEAGFVEKFKRNQPISVPLTIRDDYRVDDVVAMVQTETSSGFTKMRLRRTGRDAFSLDIPAAQHGNKKVLFYVIATDRSGHTGTLGSEQQPIELKKKFW